MNAIQKEIKIAEKNKSEDIGGLGFNIQEYENVDAFRFVTPLKNESLTRVPSRIISIDLNNKHLFNEVGDFRPEQDFITSEITYSTPRRNGVKNEEKMETLDYKKDDAFSSMPSITYEGLTRIPSRTISFDLKSIHQARLDENVATGEIVFSTARRNEVHNKEKVGLLDGDTSIDPCIYGDADPTTNRPNLDNLIASPKKNRTIDLHHDKEYKWRKKSLLASAPEHTIQNQNQIVIVGENDEPDVNIMAFLDVANDLYHRKTSDTVNQERFSVKSSRKKKHRAYKKIFARITCGGKGKKEHDRCTEREIIRPEIIRNLPTEISNGNNERVCLNQALNTKVLDFKSFFYRWKKNLPFSNKKKHRSLQNSLSSQMPTYSTYLSIRTPPPIKVKIKHPKAQINMNDLKARSGRKDPISLPQTADKNNLFSQSLMKGGCPNKDINLAKKALPRLALKKRTVLSSIKDETFLTNIIGDSMNLFQIADDCDNNTYESESEEKDNILGMFFSCITMPCSPLSIFSVHDDDEDSLYSV